jgi:hypothetical protein
MNFYPQSENILKFSAKFGNKCQWNIKNFLDKPLGKIQFKERIMKKPLGRLSLLILIRYDLPDLLSKYF